MIQNVIIIVEIRAASFLAVVTLDEGSTLLAPFRRP